MPATITHVLNVARGQLGYTEKRGNRTLYGRWYGLDGGPWCAIFVSWVADKANAEDIIPRHAYTPSGAAWFMARSRWSQSPRRGDIVYYEFPGMHRISHVGIVETVHSDGSITAIEGNTDVAGGRTGGRVMRKRRSRSLCAGFGHPAYSTPAQMAALKKKAAADAKASKLAKARAVAAAKLKAAKAKAAAALATKKRQAAAAAAAAALVAAAAGTTAVVATSTPGTGPTPQPSASVSASATPTASPKPTLKPTVTPTPHPTVKPKPTVTLRRTLQYRKGHAIQHGADVGQVQALVGIKGAGLDDAYGKKTATAVKRWQKAHGLKADGQFGRASAVRAGWHFSSPA